MALPATNPPALQSVPLGFTVGNPSIAPPAQALATALPVGQVTSANLPTLCGVDAQSGSGHVGAAAAGASTPFNIVIPLPNLPTPFTPGSADSAFFTVALASITLPAGAALSSLTVAPQAFTTGANAPIVGAQLRPGSVYTGWQALITGTMVSVVATAAGGVSVGVSSVLSVLVG